MDLPHLNVLTKIDNLKNYPDLPFNLDFYTEVQDLNYLLPHLNREQTSGIPGPNTARPSKRSKRTRGSAEDDSDSDSEPQSKFSSLNKAIVDLVEDFSLVGFETLAVEDKKSMMVLLRAIDRAGGYAFGGVEGANDTVWQLAMRQDAVTMDARDVQERWLDRREEMDEEERKAWEEEGGGKKGAEVVDRKGEDEEAIMRDEKANRAAGDGEDEDMEDIEEMRKFMESKKKDDGVKVVRR
jgi:hypothetical protein